MTQTIRHADAVEARLARKRAGHLLRFAGFARSEADGVGTLARVSRRGSGPPRRPGPTTHHSKVAVGGHGPQSLRPFGVPPGLQPINLPCAGNGRRRSRRPGLPECQGTH